jgi:hypothetical protein
MSSKICGYDCCIQGPKLLRLPSLSESDPKVKPRHDQVETFHDYVQTFQDKIQAFHEKHEGIPGQTAIFENLPNQQEGLHCRTSGSARKYITAKF